MSFLPSTNRAGILAGIYLTNCIPGPLSIFWNVSYLPVPHLYKSNFNPSALLFSVFIPLYQTLPLSLSFPALALLKIRKPHKRLTNNNNNNKKVDTSKHSRRNKARLRNLPARRPLRSRLGDRPAGLPGPGRARVSSRKDHRAGHPGRGGVHHARSLSLLRLAEPGAEERCLF
jgi:hypothetical protein